VLLILDNVLVDCELECRCNPIPRVCRAGVGLSKVDLRVGTCTLLFARRCCALASVVRNGAMLV